MTKPLIGVVAALHYEKGNPFYGLLPAYSKAVSEAGGLPVLIVPNLPEGALRDLYERLDGVLLAGGADISPSRYGMPTDDMVYGVDESRDAAEIELAVWAKDEDKPLLGICRGFQMMNVALGGSLYRDIPREYQGQPLDHSWWGKAPRHHIAHEVTVQAETRLAEALDDSLYRHGGQIGVNSLHHQALRHIAPALRIAAVAPDGVVEGGELPDLRFYMGVQWHPEELIAHSAQMRNLFLSFVKAASV
jgi:putative glutamine amidotransferase